MCGIAGILNTGKITDQRGNMQRMRDRMLHRGPDGGGTWVSEDGICTLGHQRLSILDLSQNGAQPMLSHSGKTVIVYNGEIYNYAVVRQELEKALAEKGRKLTLRSTCDTEVLQESIEFYGMERALALCKGMFAIAVYEPENRRLTLARDRVGEKPLYYGWVGDRFVFASDLGSIRAVEGFSNPICREVLDIYLEFGVIPAPYTIYEGIRKLEPGTVLTVDFPYGKDRMRQETYWSMTETAVRGQKICSGARVGRHRRNWNGFFAAPSVIRWWRMFPWGRFCLRALIPVQSLHLCRRRVTEKSGPLRSG